MIEFASSSSITCSRADVTTRAKASSLGTSGGRGSSPLALGSRVPTTRFMIFVSSWGGSRIITLANTADAWLPAASCAKSPMAPISIISSGSCMMRPFTWAMTAISSWLFGALAGSALPSATPPGTGQGPSPGTGKHAGTRDASTCSSVISVSSKSCTLGTRAGAPRSIATSVGSCPATSPSSRQANTQDRPPDGSRTLPFSSPPMKNRRPSANFPTIMSFIPILNMCSRSITPSMRLRYSV
mmetsp:Transcript_101977/g.288776  ORF Transcript_101977/g.288776 Transcript_101977/m.288776 type:complete len:242 (-) Transcript_101977:256-981(-)